MGGDKTTQQILLVQSSPAGDAGQAGWACWGLTICLRKQFPTWGFDHGLQNQIVCGEAQENQFHKCSKRIWYSFNLRIASRPISAAIHFSLPLMDVIGSLWLLTDIAVTAPYGSPGLYLSFQSRPSLLCVWHPLYIWNALMNTTEVLTLWDLSSFFVALWAGNQSWTESKQTTKHKTWINHIGE